MTSITAEPAVPPITSGRRVFGLRASAVLELAVFFAAALAVDTFLFGGSRFAGFSPHPFWLIVLLVTVQYGITEGLVAAALASAALLAFNVPPAALGEDIHIWLARVLREPVMWFATALIVGELQERHLRERRRMRGELAEAEQRERVVAESYTRLERLKETLEA